MSVVQLRVVQRVARGIGVFVVLLGLLMLIGLGRSPDGFRPAPFVGLVIIGVAILTVAVRWERRTSVHT